MNRVIRHLLVGGNELLPVLTREDQPDTRALHADASAPLRPCTGTPARTTQRDGAVRRAFPPGCGVDATGVRPT